MLIDFIPISNYDFIEDVNEFKDMVKQYEETDGREGLSFSQWNTKTNQYVEDALNEGCTLAVSRNHAVIMIKCKDHNGDEIIFYQLLHVRCPRLYTRLQIPDKIGVIFFPDTEPINIWDNDSLIKDAYKCHECGKQLNNINELYQFPGNCYSSCKSCHDSQVNANERADDHFAYDTH